MKNEFIERLERKKVNPIFDVFNSYESGYNRAINEVISLYNELHPSTEIIAPEPKAKEGSFKVRITKSSAWYNVGQEYNVIEDQDYFKFSDVLYIPKSDCEIIPETTTIPFDYNRWKSGDYLRVVTRDGIEVTQLTEFEVYSDTGNVYGVVSKIVRNWLIDGIWKKGTLSVLDLHLEIAPPKLKQVTTYHYMGINGQVKGVSDEFSVTSIGETITEQQPDGTWKIISTTLKP